MEFLLAVIVAISSVIFDDFVLLRGMFVGPTTTIAMAMGILFVLASCTAMAKIITILVTAARGPTRQPTHIL
jgi:hypothetical protein